jgi:predicted nucleic acid-binding protein
MAVRRKRILFEQMEGFLARLKELPIDAAQLSRQEILTLPTIAQAEGLTNYDAAYLALAIKSHLSLATTDNALRKAAASTGVKIL